jgi:tetratricopeptide (TPR) repeat protein
MNRRLIWWFGCAALLITACNSGETRKPVVVSLLGESYYEPERNPKLQARLDSNLKTARERFDANPSEENYIWYGRRLGYLSRFQEAIDVFTDGLGHFPVSAKLLRHRGHRYISLRKFDLAIADLKKADSLTEGMILEIEPDGQPNRINTPLSTTQFNIHYHLALAHYLKGDFVNAEKAYLKCMAVSNNDDLLVATIDWLYMTYRRTGQTDKATDLLKQVTDSMNIVENDSYYIRCKMYQGKVAPGEVLSVSIADLDQAQLAMATQGYGVGNWFLYNGDTTQALSVFKQVVSGNHFGAFGFIAAEAELARWNSKK